MDVFDIFAAKSADFISSSDLVAALLAIEGRPWAEWKNGKPITTHGLARMLAPFKVFPARVSSGSGYRLVELEDAFQRYLPATRDSNCNTATYADEAGTSAISELPFEDSPLAV